MVIDFHTHIWPDSLAPRAIQTLTYKANGICTPVTDGTRAGLAARMDEWGIDVSVVQPVITKQSQTVKTNEFAAALNAAVGLNNGGALSSSETPNTGTVSLYPDTALNTSSNTALNGVAPNGNYISNHATLNVAATASYATSNGDCAPNSDTNSQTRRILSFGALWPHTDDYKRDIDFITSLGLHGIKFHPEYQQFTVDAPQMLPLYDYALSRGLVLLFHAGEDPAFDAPFHSTPQQFARVVDAMQGGTIIAAHLGGLNQWAEVEAHLVGKRIYFDTSMGLSLYGPERFMRIVQSHGADNILFGSDSPWGNAKTELELLNALPLTACDKDKILYKNAQKLLGL